MRRIYDESLIAADLAQNSSLRGISLFINSEGAHAGMFDWSEDVCLFSSDHRAGWTILFALFDTGSLPWRVKTIKQNRIAHAGVRAGDGRCDFN
jgi:hypothetical protein